MPTKKTKQSKKKKTKTLGQQKIVTPAVASIPHLSPCARAYAKALTDPWDEPDELPCVPDTIAIPSFKWTSKARGTFKAGSSGVGWVAVSPFTMGGTGFNGSGAYTDSPIIFTDNASNGGAYTGTSYQWTVASGNVNTQGVTSATASTVVSGGNISANNVKFRCVGCGLRVRYTGTELNRGGRLILFRDRGNLEIPNWNATNFLLDQACFTSPIDRTWRGVTFIPTDTVLLSYLNGTTFQATQALNNAAPRRCLIAMIDGTTAGNSWDFEVTGYYEGVGISMTPITPSHADPAGYGAILSALPESMTTFGQGTFNAIQKGALQALEKSTSGVVQFGTTMTMGALSAYLSARSGMGMLTNGPTVTDVT